MRERRAGLTGVLIVAVLLTGCSAEQGASAPLPTSGPAPTSEALPALGPADFPVPDEARTQDPAGAEAFANYFLALMNHLRAIPGGQPIRDIAPDCQECSRIARVYDDAAAAGRRFDGGELTIESLGNPVVDNGEAVINFFAAQETASLVDGAGTVIQSVPGATRLGSGLTLFWSEDTSSWLVTGLTLG